MSSQLQTSDASRRISCRRPAVPAAWPPPLNSRSRLLPLRPRQDASRLVFVSVKDAKPKRKVAVPIGDGATWEQFCSQVRGAAPLIRGRTPRWF